MLAGIGGKGVQALWLLPFKRRLENYQCKQQAQGDHCVSCCLESLCLRHSPNYHYSTPTQPLHCLKEIHLSGFWQNGPDAAWRCVWEAANNRTRACWRQNVLMQHLFHKTLSFFAIKNNSISLLNRLFALQCLGFGYLVFKKIQWCIIIHPFGKERKKLQGKKNKKVIISCSISQLKCHFQTSE